MLKYDDIVKYERQTCFACPVIYEGVTSYGTPFYFRLRNGVARLVLNEGTNNERGTTMQAFYDCDGSCSLEEYKQMFMTMYRELTK